MCANVNCPDKRGSGEKRSGESRCESRIGNLVQVKRMKMKTRKGRQWGKGGTSN